MIDWDSYFHPHICDRHGVKRIIKCHSTCTSCPPSPHDFLPHDYCSPKVKCILVCIFGMVVS